MPNVAALTDSISQNISDPKKDGKVWFTNLDLKYAYSQLPLDPSTGRHCNFSLVGGEATGTYRFKTGFYGLTDMPAMFQKALDYTLIGLENTLCFLDDVLIVSKGSYEEHMKLVKNRR